MFCTHFTFQRNLSEKQFKEAVKYPRDQFYRLPLWKQEQLFKSARLGHTGASENPYRLRIESPENHNQWTNYRPPLQLVFLFYLFIYFIYRTCCCWFRIDKIYFQKKRKKCVCFGFFIENLSRGVLLVDWIQR